MEKMQLKKWKLTCHYPYVPILGKSVETGVSLRGIFEPIDVEVPCSIYEELEKNALIENVEEKMNSLKAEWVKDRWWLYETDFDIEKNNFEMYNLNFEGVDYACYVYLNNNYVGYHEGELLPFSMDVTEYIADGKNHLRVLVKSIPEGMGQIGCTELHNFMRHRFDYKWDFSCRLLNIGIFRPVYLTSVGKTKIESLYFKVIDAKKGKATLYTEVSGTGKYVLKTSLFDDNKTVFESELSSERIQTMQEIVVNNAKLWFPNNEGEQNTYRLQISVYDYKGILCDTKIQTVAFRNFAFKQNPGSPEGAIPYTLEVNGKKVFIKGFSITPLDQQLGRVNYEVYERFVKAAVKANANLIRVWGGGVIEHDDFYELCSRYGIMVWQDFIQSSSGVSNVPCEETEFLNSMAQEVEYTVKSKRNYPATCIFCGGNELFGKNGRPVTFDNKNIALIKSIVEKYSDVYFVPSTSSGPTQEASLTEYTLNHDIHGPWIYLGNKSEYNHFNKLKCLFAGEFGAPGVCSLEQLKRITGQEKPAVKSMQDPIWRHHGDWWEVGQNILDVFGYVPQDIEDYCVLSNYLQVNALYYAISSFRRNAPYQSGCIIWQLNEPFPNVSCTSLIDFYGNKKPAYYAVKDAFAPTNVSFKYEQLSYSANEKFETELYLACDGQNGEFDMEIVAEANGKKIVEKCKKVTIKGLPIVYVTTLSFEMPENSGGITVYAKLKGVEGERLFATFFPERGSRKAIDFIKKLYTTLHY